MRHRQPLVIFLVISVMGYPMNALGAQTEKKITVQEDHVIHSVSDISQEFSFYMDGRFAKQYLQGHGRDVRNWGSLSKLDLANSNLLLLTEGDPRIPYSEDALKNIDQFLLGGGTVLMMLNQIRQKNKKLIFNESPGSVLAEKYGAKMSDILHLTNHTTWVTEHTSERGEPLLSWRKVGKGNLLVGSRSLFGHRPDASDPINAEWITPILLKLTKDKKVDPEATFKGAWAEHELELGPLVVEHNDGTEPFARDIGEEYQKIRPHLVAITGVEPSKGMIKRLLILPTGGGGFSSGARIAIGAWWGDYPKKRYGMTELIAHEAGHSWVLPHAEPLWNEPIATWLGIQVGKRMGMPEAQETLTRQLDKGRKIDPNFDMINPQSPNATRDLIWGKSYFIFEEMERRFGPGAMAKYFQTKRAKVPADHPSYTMDDCVGIWSQATKENLFPWFRSLAFDVQVEKTRFYP
ncbi:MAG: GldG family protein [Planctomycetes bacterium]|nr:GldG family protein [Planctomycetota bacterium]